MWQVLSHVQEAIIRLIKQAKFSVYIKYIIHSLCCLASERPSGSNSVLKQN